MTTDRDFDRIAAAWLDLMPDTAPPHVLEDVLEDVALTPQVAATARPPPLDVASRGPPVPHRRDRAARCRPPRRGRAPCRQPAHDTPAHPGGSAAGSPLAKRRCELGSVANREGKAAVPAGALAESLVGTWVADVPADMSLGDPAGPARMSLVIDTNGTAAYLTTTAGPGERFRARVASPAGDRLEFITRTAGAPVTVAGAALRGCQSNEPGTYQAARSADGLLLTLTSVADACPSRDAVFGRTWVRSLSEPQQRRPRASSMRSSRRSPWTCPAAATRRTSAYPVPSR